MQKQVLIGAHPDLLLCWEGASHSYCLQITSTLADKIVHIALDDLLGERLPECASYHILLLYRCYTR